MSNPYGTRYARALDLFCLLFAVAVVCFSFTYIVFTLYGDIIFSGEPVEIGTAVVMERPVCAEA